ncbi:MAG: prepilin-type N-terminal cleavage/methylation domain-containing protein [Brevinematales bacterium]|nr:prepilin-type N-terminal cleavage/methylation domain-containing protein [Brevinematales bacterium]
MKHNKAFSLVEIMIVVTLSSVIFLVVYNLIAIGVRFFETFSKRLDFSVNLFLKDVELEVINSQTFNVNRETIEVLKPNSTITYRLGKYDSNTSSLKIKKEIAFQNSRYVKSFVLKDIFEVKAEKKSIFLREKIFLTIVDVKGNTVFEGYIP